MKQERKERLELIIYQVYPRSFKDSNNDGIGDIKGVISKLEYLKDLGINAIWLSPCYKSPNCDNGYDISDYRDIMDELGTLQDVKDLIYKAHNLGIKIIMDFVANHTSSEHEWFKQGRMSKDSPYHDYYIWAQKPLNDWQACFGGSVWEYNEPTNEYYLHSFAIGQPDLNWDNEKVRQEMCDVVDYWANLGVDGFRCDVIDYISKDFENNLICRGPNLHKYINQIFGRPESKHLFTVGECSYDEEGIVSICGENRDELTCIFQFDHFNYGRIGKFIKKDFSIDSIRDELIKWQYASERLNILYVIVTDNHDQAHYISRLGNDSNYRYECATAYGTMFYMLKGIPVIYQGQEIGTPDPSDYSSLNDFDNIETINYYNDNKDKLAEREIFNHINFGSRDNMRRPFAWDNTEYNGFGGKPWITPSNRANEVNLENDLNSEKSVFRFYKELLSLRKNSDTIKYGLFENVTQGSGHFAYLRKGEKEDFLIVVNFDKISNIDYANLKDYKYVLGNYKEKREVNGQYLPFESAIFIRKK